MPAPKVSPRPAPAPPKFNVPNLSAPRPRKKSRGVKPSAEDAIKRDPRVIALFNELSRRASVVASTVAWEAQRAQLAAAAGGSPPPRSGTLGSARRGTPTRPGSAAGTPRRPGSASPAPATPSPRPAAGVPPSASPAATAGEAAERELTEEEAAAYLPTLPARGAAVAAFEPRSLQEVSDFVADVKAQGGDAPRSGHAAVGFPGARWRLLADAAAVFDQLLDMCDTLTKWECRPQVGAAAAGCGCWGLGPGGGAAAELTRCAGCSLAKRLPRHAYPSAPDLVSTCCQLLTAPSQPIRPAPSSCLSQRRWAWWQRRTAWHPTWRRYRAQRAESCTPTTH